MLMFGLRLGEDPRIMAVVDRQPQGRCSQDISMLPKARGKPGAGSWRRSASGASMARGETAGLAHEASPAASRRPER